MENSRKITLYYKIDNDKDQLRCSFLNSLGSAKVVLLNKLLDDYLNEKGISDLDKLTLRDIEQIKKDIALLQDTHEEYRRRGRGRPSTKKKVEAAVKKKPQNSISKPVEVIATTAPENNPDIQNQQPELQPLSNSSQIVQPANNENYLNSNNNSYPSKDSSDLISAETTNLDSTSSSQAQTTQEEDNNDFGFDADLFGEIDSFV